MPEIYVTSKQVLKWFKEEVEYMSAEELQGLILQLLRTYSKYDACYFDNIKRFVDKQYAKQEHISIGEEGL